MGVLTLSQHPPARILDHGTREILTPKLASSRVSKGPHRNLDVPLSGRKLRPPRPHALDGIPENGPQRLQRLLPLSQQLGARIRVLPGRVVAS